MATAAPYYRVPVVVFAVLVGSLYVYAKSGGALFRSRTHVTPAVDANSEELAPPRVEFMMGPKSAPAFDADGSYVSPFENEPPPASRAVLGGSKSHAVVEPSDLTPPTNATPQPRLLPGSKSVIVFPPVNTQSPPSVPPTNNAAPNHPRAFPGSKSAILISPEQIQQARSNSSNKIGRPQLPPGQLPGKRGESP